MRTIVRMSHGENAMKRKELSARQKKMLVFIRQFIERHGYPPTIREIGKAVGASSTSVVNYNLDRLADRGYIERVPEVSRGLRLVPQNNESVPTPPGTQQLGVVPASATAVLQVPLVGTIAASEPVPTPDDVGYYYDTDDLIDVPLNLIGADDARDLFALRVVGDSMIDAMVAEGDIVILRRQAVAQNGDMVAVWLDERGETTLKKYYLEGEQVRLQPANPTMQPIYVPAEHVRVQGRVLAVLRTLH